ncbi:MAG: 3-phosphoglycerate dehydrogenase, partial [Lachnospiraceae bacterium]|nr:3-phosphoglycerate dehydrogenase [Lachnospiraceae bacterium]
VPENKDTKGMVGAEALALMKEDAALLNFARPGLVDEAALKEALEGGKIRKYVTDVPSFVTANLPNVIAFPHLGASTEEAEDASAIMAVDEIIDYLENGNIVNSVNFPALSLGPKAEGQVRVSVLFKAEEGIAEKLSGFFGGFGLKNSVVKTRGAYGAGLFELSAELCPCKVNAAIPGLLRVRVLK